MRTIPSVLLLLLLLVAVWWWNSPHLRYKLAILRQEMSTTVEPSSVWTSSRKRILLLPSRSTSKYSCYTTSPCFGFRIFLLQVLFFQESHPDDIFSATVIVKRTPFRCVATRASWKWLLPEKNDFGYLILENETFARRICPPRPACDLEACFPRDWRIFTSGVALSANPRSLVYPATPCLQPTFLRLLSHSFIMSVYRVMCQCSGFYLDRTFYQLDPTFVAASPAALLVLRDRLDIEIIFAPHHTCPKKLAVVILFTPAP